MYYNSILSVIRVSDIVRTAATVMVQTMPSFSASSISRPASFGVTGKCILLYWSIFDVSWYLYVHVVNRRRTFSFKDSFFYQKEKYNIEAFYRTFFKLQT